MWRGTCSWLVVVGECASVEGIALRTEHIPMWRGFALRAKSFPCLILYPYLHRCRCPSYLRIPPRYLGGISLTASQEVIKSRTCY
ncbi:hypothetical protein BGY98DRAFT_363699 [Russula aff. rugulosa BPL654]|nr:hypothetical protein BGY98DRAFT_363699 [Russula aff. rugulosa BPL654]